MTDAVLKSLIEPMGIPVPALVRQEGRGLPYPKLPFQIVADEVAASEDLARELVKRDISSDS